jgi:hypothetical protein
MLMVLREVFIVDELGVIVILPCGRRGVLAILSGRKSSVGFELRNDV